MRCVKGLEWDVNFFLLSHDINLQTFIMKIFLKLCVKFFISQREQQISAKFIKVSEILIFFEFVCAHDNYLQRTKKCVPDKFICIYWHPQNTIKGQMQRQLGMWNEQSV